ncbi:uncharacterized protein, partial [Hetaerina americana]|uniref:uncharacterized protein n=1 Tax=Hetaerina americana TaxID=62018 RepID=UPI003A7F379B
DDYYCADDVALPIRWCAPETLHCTDTTIETKEVTTSANIWSFGVFLWELCEFGRLPYTELNDEEVIVKVLSEKSLHLGPPSRPCLQSNNLYHLMRLCWNSNHQRPAMAQVTAMLHNLSLHPEQNPGWSFEDFECHWATMKPNGTTAVVETIVHEPPMEMQPREVGEGGRESMHRNLTPSPHPSLHDEPMSPDIKHKSPSLQNLHGSLEDLVEASCPQEEDAGKDVACPALGELNDAPCEDIPLEPKSSALWLNDCESQLGATEDDEDAQFVRKISEAIRDLDDVLALEKTSSSSGSGTSPEEHSPTKKRFAQLSHEKIDENGVLDFRLDCRKEEGEGISKEGVVKARVDGDVTEEEAVPLSTRVGGLLWEGTESIATEGFKGNANGSLDRGAGLPLGEGGGSAGVLEGAAKSKSALEEEEEEVWRQRVERCEFSAKVREKSRSVQDLMVLTHIDDSSEGSDCEGGGRSNVGSPPPGPLLQHPGHSPSFGSVGDLRGAVLGDEFRHTLERLCSANKRGSFSRAGPSLSMGVVSNFLEELEDTKSHPETSEQLSAPMSSHDNATIGKTKPLPSPLEPLHSVTSTISGPTPAEVCLGITINETSAGDLAEVLSDSCENEDAQSLPRTLHNQFVVESCKKFSDVITSTPIGNAMRNSSVNEDSFLFDSPLSDTAGQVECSTIKSGVLGSSVSSLDPTFPESSPTFPSPAKIVNAKSNCSVIHEIIKSENCDSSVSVKSDEVSGDITDTDPSLQTLSNDMSERAHSQSGNLALCGKDVTLMALVGAVNVPDAQSLQDIVKMSESPSSPLPLVATLSVSPLSILAMNCLSSFNPKHLDKNNFCTKFSNKLGDNVDASLSVIQGNDEKGVDQTAFEKSPQESPLSEFPGDLSEQSPLHCLTHGISGSQSTVECRSPLALSPITIGIEDANTTTSSILLTSVQQEMVLNDGSSPCEEKLKSDGVTKEINSDFIFAVGPSVENMDPVMKPDLLLDTEKLEKCTSLNGRQVQADLIGNSNINLQENVVEALITSIEADRNHGSWLKPNVSSKGLENSHILLDLVQINSNKLEKSSDPSDELSRINEPIQVIPSYDKKSKGPSSPEFLVGKKDINPGNNKSEKVEKECQSEEKENAMSDVANSEDCDSAGTEDSVFDFSPPAPDTNGDSVKMECSEHPQGRHIGCTEERHGGEGGRFDGSFEKSCFGPCEASVREDGVEVHGEAPRRDEEEDEEELVLLGAKQWTPDDERSSDSGFRDKGSLSESVEDACERCDLADVEVEGMGGGEMVAKVNPGQGCVMPGDYPGDDEYMNGSDEVYVSANEEEPSKSPERFKSSPPPPAQRDEDHEEFWRQQMASLRQAAGDTASLLREASAPGDGSSWTEGETWDEDVTGNCKEPNIPAEGEGVDRGLDEASLAALRSELQEKLGGSNNRFGAGVEAKGKDASYEGTHGEERLSEGEEEDDGEEASEERADITIHYDAYLAQLSPILEERESVGSSEMYSPASKEPPRDSVSDDSATTASVNDIGDNQVFLADAKNPVFSMEDVLVVDTSTNQASFIVSGGAVDLQENDATSPEFSDSLEDDDNEDSNSNEKSENTPKEHAETCVGDSVAQTNNLPMARYNIPPSDFWTGIPSIHSWNGINGSAPSNGGCRPSPPRSPLLLPPPPSSAPMPSPEEERAGCVERSCSKTIPIFRDFEDIVALCQTQRDDFSGCANVTVDGLQGDSQRSSEETETSISGSAQNIPFWESESSDGNDSSSSGEFVWKEGERDIPQAVDGPALESVSRVYESLSDFPMAVIEEEDEEEACDGEKDDGASDSSGSVMEFIPSVWNSAAEPGHSSLRSPDRKS